MKIRYALLALLAVISILVSGCGNKSQSAAKPAAKPAEAATKPAEQPTTTAAETPATTPPDKPAETPATKPADKPAKAVGKWITTDSGLKYKDKKIGDGAEVRVGDKIKVDYKGWLNNGKVFDTSMQPGREPFTLTVGVGEVISGWDEGLVGMKVGGDRELTIPPDLGYRDRAMGPIPPNSTLHFTVKVLAVVQ